MPEPSTPDPAAPDTGDPADAPQWLRPLTLRGAVTQSWLIHPDWTPSIHLQWLDDMLYDTSRWENPEKAIAQLLHGLRADAARSTEPAAPSGADAATTDPAEELTPEFWHEAARRAYRRDHALLADAFTGITMTADLRRLFAGVVYHLDRDSLLALAGLPALLRATPTAEPPEGASPATTTAPPDDLDLTVQAVAAVQAHRSALHEHLSVAEPGPGLQRSTVVADTGQRVLDIASIVTRQPVFTVAPTDHAYALSVNPPQRWTGYQSTFAVLLRRGDLLLGFYDGVRVHAFPHPEPVDVLIGGRVVTVRTATGRLLILDSWVEVYRPQAHADDLHLQPALPAPPPNAVQAA